MQKQTTRLARLIGRALKTNGIACSHTQTLDVAAQIAGLKNFQTLQAKLGGKEKPTGKPQFQTVPDESVRHIWRDPESQTEVGVPPDYYQTNGEPSFGNSGQVCDYLRTEVLLPHDPSKVARDPLAAWIQKAVAEYKGKEKCKPTKAHLFQVLVLTDRHDEYDPGSLEQIANDIDNGDYIGDWRKKGEQKLTAEETYAILLEIGNDGTFFEPEDDEEGTDEVMAEGRYVRVSLCDIGEGRQGDYDDEDPNDIPFLRMDIARRGKHGGQDVDDNEWGNVRNGSFCTGIDARTPVADQKEICLHFAKELSKISTKQSMGHVEILSHIESKEQALATKVLPDGFIELGTVKTDAETYSDGSEPITIDLRKGQNAHEAIVEHLKKEHQAKDPFRPAELSMPCPKCGDEYSFNREDMGSGFHCIGCGHHFTEAEEKKALPADFSSPENLARRKKGLGPETVIGDRTPTNLKAKKPKKDEVTEIAKARMQVNRTRETLLEELKKLLPEKGAEICFFEKINESLCTESSNNCNHCIEGVRHEKEGVFTVFGNDEDASCGASIGEFEDPLEDLSTENLLALVEMIDRALKV